MDKTFGEKLKEARLYKKLKQSELAKELGVSNTTISNWEKNISKPDLDMLSFICGVLDVKASYFLEAKLPDGQISIPEFNLIKKYRDLDDHGKEMVDFTLRKEWERCDNAAKTTKTAAKIAALESENCLNAAHNIGATSEQKAHADSIMEDDSEWE